MKMNLELQQDVIAELSLAQLEGALVAANLLLDAWRTTTLCPLDNLRPRLSYFERSSVSR